MVYDWINSALKLTKPDGSVYEFAAFRGLIDAPAGRLMKVTSAGGQTLALSYGYNGHPSQVTRSAADGSSTLERYQYAQVASGENVGRIEYVTLQRYSSGTYQNVSRVTYTYYETTDTHGDAGDLKTATRQNYVDGQWVDEATHYYRYYRTGDANGCAHGLKYILGPAAYANLCDDPSVSDPFTATDAKVAEYADNYFEYDSARRAVKETVRGGEQTFTLAYTSNAAPVGPNEWRRKTVETRPDGSNVTTYTSHFNSLLLKQIESPDGQDVSIEYWQYDDDGREILHATPGAVASYVDNGGANSDSLVVTLEQSDGKIELTEYYTTGAVGHVKNRKIKQGSSGTPITLEAYEYTSRSIGGQNVYDVSKVTKYRNEDGSGAIETHYSYELNAGRIAARTTTLPAVPTSQNGSGISAVRVERFDSLGNLAWIKDERGYITYRQYDATTGALIQTVQDVDDTLLDVPSGWQTPNDGGKHLVTDFEVDDRGRTVQVLGPEHEINQQMIRTATWTVYDDANHEVRAAQGYAVPDEGGVSSSPGSSSETYTYTLVNPVTIRKSDADGKVLEEIQATRASTSGKLTATDTFAQSSYTRWTTHHYNAYGQKTATRLYHTIPPSGVGTSSTNYDEQRFAYDSRGRTNMIATPGGTITRSIFDHHGNRTAEWIGTDDTGAADSDPTGNSATGNNMVVVAEFEYGTSGCGCQGTAGHLSKETRHVDATTTRVTDYAYDWRGRSVTTDGELDFFEKRSYDNLDQVVKVERYDTNEQGNLIARNETFYDDRGQIYQTKKYAVNVDSGAVGNALVSNAWYDAVGNTIKEQSAGSQAFTKTVYDSVGRPVKRYLGHDTDETAYADASSVSDDTIVEQVEMAYNDVGNVIQTTTRHRFHNATGTGELTSPSGSQPKARVTYQATYSDEIGRQIAMAEYGTYGGTTFDRAAIVPTRTDTILVNSTEYDDAGNAYKTIDPAGKEHRTVFDDRARKIKSIQNYVDGNPAIGNADEDVTVEMTYNADGNMETLTAKNSTTGDQTTTYVYGTTLSDSGVVTSTLKRAEIYPDSDDTVALGDGADGVYDRIEFKYDRQQAVVEVKDQQGTIHAFGYDDLGRQTQDRVTTLGSGVDEGVRRIATEFDVLGRKSEITSYDNPTVGSGSVVNELAFVYDDFGQLVTEYQEHCGTVNMSTSLKVQYAYEDGTDNNVRLTKMTYPDGRQLSYDYGSSGSTDDALSRVASLIDNDGTTHLVDYSYLGRKTFVKTDYTGPDLRYDLAMGAGNDPYDGFDRFGRVVDSRWYDYGSSADVDRIKYGYDRAGNRTYREQTCDPNSHHDEVYGYDGVNRLIDFNRGTINGGKDAISTLKFAQQWSLDPTGNWSGFKEDLNGDSTWDLDQSRTSSDVNEITDITETSGAAWVTPAYNRAGNMTTIPKPADPTGSFAGTYDAWNRLVKLEEGEDALAEYVYDGAKRRVVKKTYSGGSLDETRHFYYTDPQKWQVIEERLESSGTLSANPDRQFVWGLRYIDDLALRDRDTDANGTLDERLYALQDANWNVVGLVATSGAVRERYAYMAYGMPRVLTPTFATRTSSNYDAEVLYTGYWYDPESGLSHVRNRMLHPYLGCWMQRDPLGYADGPSLFQYCISNPGVHSDPTGTATLAWVFVAIVVMGILIWVLRAVWVGVPRCPIPPGLPGIRNKDECLALCEGMVDPSAAAGCRLVCEQLKTYTCEGLSKLCWKYYDAKSSQNFKTCMVTCEAGCKWDICLGKNTWPPKPI